MKYFSLVLLFLSACFSQPKPGNEASANAGSRKKPAIVTGAEQMDKLIPLLRGKRVALVVNQSSLEIGRAHV